LAVWEHLPNTTTLSASTRSDLAAFPSDWPDVQYIFNCAGPPTNNTGDFISVGVVLMKPTSRGSVTINSTDTADNPLVDVQWFASSTDQEVGVKALERVRVFANATGVISGPEILPGPGVQTDAQILDWVKSAAIPSHHAVGSCEFLPSLLPSRQKAATMQGSFLAVHST
jgi:choline dehydrogenase